MRTLGRYLSRLCLPVACVAALGVSPCDPGDDDDTTSTKLQWYYTCGDPVCSGYKPPEGVQPCGDMKAGDACSQEGQVCDPKDECNRLLLCTAEDPAQEGCPISQRETKRDIRYLGGPELGRYHDALLQTRLATYHYKAESSQAPRRLGFIIDDQPQSASVLPNGERVDLYGYTSMTVAAVQVQAKQIEALEAELKQLRKDLEASRAPAKCR